MEKIEIANELIARGHKITAANVGSSHEPVPPTGLTEIWEWIVDALMWVIDGIISVYNGVMRIIDHIWYILGLLVAILLVVVFKE